MQYVTTGQFNSRTHSFVVKIKQLKQRLRNWQNGAPEYTVKKYFQIIRLNDLYRLRKLIVMVFGVQNYIMQIYRIFIIVFFFKFVVHMVLVSIYDKNKERFLLYLNVIITKILV